MNATFTKLSFFFLSTFFACTQAMSFELGEIRLSGLGSFKGKFVSLYLVHASKILVQDPTIKKVTTRLDTKLIQTEASIFEATQVEESWSNFSRPNFIVAVVHNTEDHALNKNPILNGKFEPAVYENAEDAVEPNTMNTKEFARKYYAISSFELLGEGFALDLSK